MRMRDKRLRRTTPALRYHSINSSTQSMPTHSSDSLIRLVAVGLKEASSDSPCFRASIRYADTAILTLARTLRDIGDFLQHYSDVAGDVGDLQEDFNALFAPINASGAANELVNRDVAAPRIDATVSATNDALSAAQALLCVNTKVVAQIDEFLDTDLAQYLTLRSQFEAIQRKYGTLLSKYLALPRGCPPEQTREDAQQLFEIRKQYVHVSLTLWTSVKKVGISVSELLVEVCASLEGAHAAKAHARDGDAQDPTLPKHTTTLAPALAAPALSAPTLSTPTLSALTSVRQATERGFITLFSPSTDLRDYDAGTVSADSVFYPESSRQAQQREKHGWVYLKAKLLDTHEIVWLQRWLFVKGGVFGFLTVSANGRYVQESDRIGVLLANAQLCTENRKFCFEIRMRDCTLVLQVETLAELRSWLTVFRTVKREAAAHKVEGASARFAPALNEFRMVPVGDTEEWLIKGDSADGEGDSAATARNVSASTLRAPSARASSSASAPALANPATRSQLSQLISTQLHRIHLPLTINPPIVTQMTTLAALSHLYISATNIPSATTANFWGFVNWGLYYVGNEQSRQFLRAAATAHQRRPELVLRYPRNFPLRLRVADAELRAVFEGYIAPDELVMVAFKCAWAPNSHQELYCSVYVTQRAFYIYTNNCGLISVSPIPATSILYCEAGGEGAQMVDSPRKESADKDSADKDSAGDDNADKANASTKPGSVKMFLVSGLSVKLTVSSGAASICRQVNLVLKNGRSAKPRSADALLELLTNPGAHKKDPARAKSRTPASASGVTTVAAPGSTSVLPLWTKRYNMPAKALFHALLGDKSRILRCMMLVEASQRRGKVVGHTDWRCNRRQVMTRIMWGVTRDHYVTRQQIQRMVNNRHYHFTLTSPRLRILFGILRRVQIWFTIDAQDERRCTLTIGCVLEKDHRHVGYITQAVIRQILLYKLAELDRQLREVEVRVTQGEQGALVKDARGEKDAPAPAAPAQGKIRARAPTHHSVSRMVAYAVKHYGVLTKYDSEERSPEEVQFDHQLKYISFRLLCICYLDRLHFVAAGLCENMGKRWRAFWGALTRTVTGNTLWVALLVVSLLLNMLLVGKTARAYWQMRSVNRYADEVTRAPTYMQRAISLHELNEMLDPATSSISYNASTSACFQQFIEQAHKRKRSQLIELRLKRNEILAQMNVLNSIERNYIYKEWQNWVLREHGTCARVRDEYGERYAQVMEYCKSVEMEMDNIAV